MSTVSRQTERKGADFQGYHGEPMRKKTKGSSVGHRIKGPDRGMINVINAPVNKKTVRPERTVLIGRQRMSFKTLWTTADPGAGVNITAEELCPGAWLTNSAPEKGVLKGNRIKDEINVHSWKMRLRTDLPGTSLDGVSSYRMVILQMLDDEGDVAQVASGGYQWNWFFNTYEADTFFHSHSEAQADAANKLAVKYKVILDHVWPAMDKDHYEEITLGPHVQKYKSDVNATNAIPTRGRFIMFLARKSDVVGASNADTLGLHIQHRLVYSDE